MKTITIENLADIIGAESLKTLARVYGRTEDQIAQAVVAGHPKVLADLKRLVAEGVNVVKTLEGVEVKL